MEVTRAGIVSEPLKPLQPLVAKVPMEVTWREAGGQGERAAAAFRKAPLPMEVTLSGKRADEAAAVIVTTDGGDSVGH